MFGLLVPKDENIEEIDAQLFALEKIISLTGSMSLRDRNKLETLYYKKRLLEKKQPTNKSDAEK